MAALADALAGHLRAGGVNVVLDCVVNRISTADAEGVLVEGVQVRGHPCDAGYDNIAKLHGPSLLLTRLSPNRCER